MSADWLRQIDESVDRRFERMVALRRHLHMNPELSGRERETSLHLYQLLGDEGLEVSMGHEGCGVLADLSSKDGAGAERLIALRADIDALRIHDAKDVPYRSRCPGVMHACGHDAHTATVFGALGALIDLRAAGALPPGLRIRGIFQPAEETCEGAVKMIGVGAIDGVDAILAVHVDPSRPVGRIGFRAGVLTANCDEMQIIITGRGGHAARPHEASDPIAAAAQLISALYQFIPRVTDSQDAVVVTIGQIVGGDNSNVIPEQVRLRGTIRTLERRVRQRTAEHIRRLAAGIAQTSDTQIEVQFGLGCHSVVNDARLIDLLRRATRDALGNEGVDEIARPSMGSEDFAFYLERIPGAMIRVGCSPPGQTSPSLHSPTFDIDESALRVGARVLALAVLYWASP